MLARTLTHLLLLALPLTVQAAAPGGFSLGGEPEFLSVDEAFVLETHRAGDGSVLARWRMPDGYYLYRHRFGFELPAGSPHRLGEPEIPPGKRKVDEYFGEVEVYYHEARARLPVLGGSDAPLRIGVTYQGCADRGLCYPPETKWVSFTAGGAAVPAPPPSMAAPAAAGAIGGVTEERRLAGMLSDGGMLTALAIFFLAGIGLAFTPCVLPMVPILSSIIVGDAGGASRTRAFSLSLAYVLGMAVTYATLGVLMGTFGASLNLQAALQSPPVLIAFAAVFVALSLSMFGFYELRLPAAWTDRIDAVSRRHGGGKHLSVVIMGALSSLVVSPCVSAPLAGALVYISATGDAVAGGGALLALALGMGVPLLVIGASGGHLLPRAGAWMNNVKAVFGVGLLAVAVWLLERVVPGPAALLLWASLAIGAGVYLGALDFSARRGWAQLWKASGALSFVYGVLLVIGAASGAEDPLRPLGNLGGSGPEQETVAFLPVSGLVDVRREIASARRPVMLDLYADWCISCKVMERSVFPAERVASRLATFKLLRADVTENDATDKALMDAYGLFGPPSLVFFAPDGTELKKLRVQGEIDAEALAAHLERVQAVTASMNFAEPRAKVDEMAGI